ncbi:sialidase family protein [Mucilaginibacter sp. UYCu711]|uniref:sialidase family protein n=1 Tax=Mucilaginibacter sp. UYCu711 TaxID=3156339 RepID=UPI003D23DFEB
MNNHNNTSRRKFLQNSSLLLAGIPLMRMKGFAAPPFNYQGPVLPNNVPQTVLADRRIKLDFSKEVMVLNDGLQPSMLCTRKGTLIVQSQNHNKPLPQARIFYPFAMSTVVSRDGGETWNDFPLKEGDNGVDIEGGITQLKDGTIIALETYVTPGDKPDTGAGLMYTSTDEYKTLQGPFDITFDIPNAEFYGSADDGGRPHIAMRLHRRILELPNGDLLTTIYGFQKGDDEPCPYQPKMKKSRVMLFKSKNKGKHWNFVSTVAVDKKVGTEGFGEPVIARVSKGPKAGRLICQMRTGYELYSNHSDDGGKTWTKAKPLVYANLDVYKTSDWAAMFKDVKRKGVLVTPDSPELIGAVVDPDLIETRSGILVAAFGVRISAKLCWTIPTHPWNGNYLAFSLDHGDTWSHVTRLTTGIDTTHYMCVEETSKNNELFVVYDFGHWNGKEGRYTYGRKVKISV